MTSLIMLLLFSINCHTSVNCIQVKSYRAPLFTRAEVGSMLKCEKFRWVKRYSVLPLYYFSSRSVFLDCFFELDMNSMDE